MSFFNQLSLLLWKNYQLRKRHKMRLVIELLCPLVLFLIFMWVRTKGLKFNKPHCHLVEKALPSVGGFEFFQSFVCTLNNTCHEDFVEDLGPKEWEDALFIKFIRETGPLIHELLERQDGVDAVHSIWKLATNFMKITVGTQSQANLTQQGNVVLDEIMPEDSKDEFISNAELYLGLSRNQAEQLLKSEIIPTELNNKAVNEFIEDISKNDCGNQTKYKFIQIPSEEVFNKICSLNSFQAQLVTAMFQSSVGKNDIGKMMQQVLAKDQAEAERLPSIPQIDPGTIKIMMELAAKFSDFSRIAGGLVSDNSTGVSAFTRFMYKGMCGLNINPNSTSFGFDNNEVSNRMDSFRDRLRDWRAHTSYTPDPEVDETCNLVFEQLHSRPFTSLLWRQVKPLVRGQILYAPKTNFTVELMEKVNERFSELHQLEEALNLLVTIVHRVRVWYLTNSVLLAQVQELLRQNGTITIIETMISNAFGGGKLGSILAQEENKERLESILNRFRDTDFKAIDSTLESYDFRGEGHSHVLSCIRYNKMVPFDTECDAVEHGMQLLPDGKLWAVVVFEDMPLDGTAPQHVKYKIRMDSDKVDSTRRIRDRLTAKSPRRRPTLDLKYVTNGFIYLQELIEHSIIEKTTGHNISGEVATILQQFPYPCYIYDQFIRAISRTFPLFMVLSWVYASAMIVKSIVLEKELRLKEVMKVMGLSNTVIWIGWFIDSAVVMTISTFMLTLILKFGKIIEFSEFSLILVFMLCFTLATICFSFLISTLFSRANSAAAAGGIIFFISYLPYNFMLLWEEHLTWHHLLFSCLISNVAFGFGCTYLARYEEDGIGAQWSRITLQTVPDDNFNLVYCILMLLFDSVLYLILAWYIENVFPGENGTPRKWYFLFQQSYWCPAAAANAKYQKERKRYESGLSDAMLQESLSPTTEAEPEDLTLGVEVVNLSKTYPNGRVALQNFVMNFYEGQITSFLGHNGAGKTTAISILTGLFPPTKGTARIYGQDIRTQMTNIRKDLGICPQYNVLFDRLTVEEHLKFYSGLKGKEKTSKEEMDKMLYDLGIPHKRHDFPSSLSGGMKRKLSVACAFVGGSKTVFLDEPTSGVDPYSRRSIWELLLKYKAGRTVILTTHFMDEADILGDRIAIISQGRLVASGTSLFLKSHYGQGYSLRLVRDEMSAPEEELMLMNNIEPSSGNPDARSTAKSVALNRHTDLCTNFVHFRVPDAVLMDDVGSEIVYLLPYLRLDSFPGLFHDLDENLGNLRVSSYGISDTTLEDVFLKITAEDLEAARWDNEARFCHACCCNALIMSRIWKMRKNIKKQSKLKRPDEVEPPPVIVHSLDAGYISPADHIIPSVQEQMKENKANGNTPHETDAVTGTSNSNPNSPNTSDDTNETILPELAEAEPDVDVDAALLAETQAHDIQELAITFRSEPPKRSNSNLAFLQLRVILRKRYRNSTRNLRALFFEIILPVVFIAVALALTLILPPPANELPRLVTPWAYPTPNYIFFAEPEPASGVTPIPKLFDNFVDEMIGPIGIGPPCMYDDKVCPLNPTWGQSAKDKFMDDRAKFNGSQLGHCSCNVGSFQCSQTQENPPPPRFTTPGGDYVLDVSKMENVPKWIRQTYTEYEHRRYGGYQMVVRAPVDISVSEYIFLIDCLTTLTKPHNKTQELLTGKVPRNYFKVWFENRAWLSSIAYLNSLNNALLRHFLPSTLPPEEKAGYGMTLFTHPMNLTKLQQEKESLKTAALGVVHAICVIFALGFVPASFTMYLIEERHSGAKHLHLVSGVKPVIYWIASLMFDMGKYMIPVCLCLTLFYAFSAEAYIGSPSIGAFSLLLILYGWASIPLMYPASYHFSVPSTAFVVLGCTNLFIGVITTVSVFVLEQLGDDDLEEIGRILQQVFLIFPQYCLGTGLMKLVRLHIEDTAFSRFSGRNGDEIKNRFAWTMLGKPLTFLAIHGIVFFLLNLTYEYKQWLFLLCKRRHFKNKWSPKTSTDAGGVYLDTDVKREADRVLRMETSPSADDTLVAENLTKVYNGRMMPSVNKISFGVERGECFGLLGVNGAGKTTTFKMLTGDVRITYGNAKIMGFDVEKSLDTARKHFGYCPQEDGLDPLLNTFEQLELYGRLRGMTLFDVHEMSNRLVGALGLTRYADKRCGTYSGGNKRKVSTAIALIGNPDLVFLDEPTSGMDPGARRQLWKVILKIVHAGKSVVLTSHSMEECEALCNRLAIMVNGRFMCLGSLQHLKNRFGNGYMLTVRCGLNTRQEFLNNLASELPSAVLDDTHCSQLKFKILQQDVKLGEIFSVMHKEKLAGLVEDYSVSQTTLDDIFVKFASKQKDELDNNVKIVPNSMEMEKEVEA